MDLRYVGIENGNKIVVKVKGVSFGDGEFSVIAGPCSVENKDMILKTAVHIKALGAVMLRGGAFKPRTSPYSFQGLEEDGLKLLKEASEVTGLPVVSEVMDPRDIEMTYKYVDMFQIGSRNMQNFSLLKEVGRTNTPVLLKRGMSATIEEFLMAAEYIAHEGNMQIVLCERGIRTFENYTRNMLDVTAIPVLKKLSRLPVIFDPSHGTGMSDIILPMTLAGMAAGSDGVIIEVHPDPGCALSDGDQSLSFEQFERLIKKVNETEKMFEDIRRYEF
jgi:3-deoxy-7-phosphoheptulonate synthase